MKYILLITTLIIWTNVSYASESSQTDKFDFATTYIELGCDFERAKEHGLSFNKWFADYDKAITQYSLNACKKLYEDKEKAHIVDDYWPIIMRQEILFTILEELSQKFELNDETEFKKLKGHYKEWQLESDFFSLKDKQLYPPNFDKSYNNRLNKNEYFLTKPSGLPRIESDMFVLNNSQNLYCINKFKGALNCQEVFDQFEKVTEKLTVFENISEIKKHNAYIKVNNANWDKFAENSRFQTFIDVSFTSLIYREHLSNSKDIITPPPLQWFAIRPGIVYEYFDKANKGEKNEVAVSMEWLGFNAWDLKVPLGVSFTSLYADRKSGKSISHGLMLHVNNSFSFGVTSRGGDASFFVNLELMDWFGKKQNKLKQYKKYQF